MVAPSGGGNEEISYTIKINAAEAKKALEDIIQSEDNVATKTENLKNLLIKFATDTGVSIEKASQSFKKMDAVFAGTTNSIINNAAKLARVQLLPQAGPTTAGNMAGPDLQEEAAIAAAATRIKIEGLQAEQAYEQARHAQAVADRQMEAEQIVMAQTAIMQAKANEAAATLTANQQIVASVQQIINAETTLAVKVEQLRALMMSVATANGLSLEQVAAKFKGLEGAFAGSSTGLVNLAVGAEKAREGLAPLPAVIGDTADKATGLGNVVGRLEFSFIRLAAIGAVIGFFRDVIQFFNDATTAAIKFNQTLFEFEAGVRAVQRTGLEVTIADYKKEIEDLQKTYPIFSKQSLMEGYSQILLLARGLNFTKEQLRQIAEVSITASTVLGRDFGETAMGITKSLSSGWFEAAQRAGFLINRQAVVDEGLRLNIENAKRGYNAMTAYERALAALSVYVQENKSIQGDVTKIMDTQAGKVQQANAAWANLKLSVGQVLSPMKALGAESLQKNVFPAIDKYVQGQMGLLILELSIIKVIEKLINYLGLFGQAFVKAFKQEPVIQGIINTLTGFRDFIVATIRAVFRFADIISKAFINIIPDSAIKKVTEFFSYISSFFSTMSKGAKTGFLGFNFAEEWQKALADTKQFIGLTDLLGNTGKEAGLAFGQGLEDGLSGTNVADAFTKLTQNIFDEFTALKQKLENLWIDFNRKVQDIITDTQRRIAEANRKYQQDILNENISYAQRRADAERKYRINEIDAEARFQEQLRQLREKFLFDLEDALRERDARQVLRLTRQYQMDKENVSKEAELAYKERQRAYQEELRQLAEQHAERLRLINEEYQAELAQIRLQEQQKIADAALAYMRELEDAKKAAAERIAQQTLDFQRQYGLTQQQAQALVKLLQSYFGTTGPVAQLYNNLVQYILRLVSIAQAGLNSLGGITVPNVTPSPNTSNRYAKGGTMIATKPTRAIFGEAGAEVATFTPISQLSQHQQNVVKAFSDINVNSNQQGTGGNLELVVTLDPNLKAEIVNESMYNVSAIVREVNRAR